MDIYLFQQINGMAGHSIFLDTFLMLCAKYLPVVFALFLAGFWLTRQPQQQRGAFLAGVSALLALGLAQIVNAIVLRPRPYMYAARLLVDRTTDTSFPSDHTTLAFAVASFVWQFNRKCAIALFGLALLQGFARVYVGAHYPGDVLGGAVLGILASIAVRRLSDLPTVRHLLDGLFAWLAKWSIAAKPASTQAQ
ncbi:MAG: undecaprenyl-diphosphatase [Chloroflexota bacterium]